MANRYRGRVRAYIIWNEPNLAAEWGGQPPDAQHYARMLAVASSAIRRADPQALVVTAGLAPTNEVSSSAVDDRVFLEQLYAAGAGPHFDLVGAHPYGFGHPPDEPRGAHDGLNFTRLEELRAIMVANGDGHKEIWATEFGWTSHVPDATTAWQQVSEAEKARYLVAGYRKASWDYPWLGLLAVWNLGGRLTPEDSFYGYSIVGPDHAPLPSYHALARMNDRRLGRSGGLAALWP